MSEDFRSLDWRDYKTWRQKLLRCLPDCLNRDVFESIRQRPPRYFVSDNLAYLEDAIARTTGQRVNIKSLLVQALSKEFDFLRAFHGCRPITIESYQKAGLLPSNVTKLEGEAITLFGDSQRVQDRIGELRTEENGYCSHNVGKVFFCLTMEELVEHCGHYLLYGSEYLLCVANWVGGAHVLRARGKATVIECNVPISDIPIGYLEDMCGMFLVAIIERFCTGRTDEDGKAGFYIEKTLQPTNIVAFHHPRNIPNPHNCRLRED